MVADFVVRAMKRNPKVIYRCDPVIGDAERGVFVAHGLPGLFRDRLCPIANVLTPNHFELEWLGARKLEATDSLVAAARTLSVVGDEGLNQGDIEKSHGAYHYSTLKSAIGGLRRPRAGPSL